MDRLSNTAAAGPLRSRNLRRFLRVTGRVFAVAALGALAGCQQPQTTEVAPPPASEAPTVAPPATAARAQPTAAAQKPSERMAPTVAPQRAEAAKAMYQMDPQHTGRSPYAGPRKPMLMRTFDLNQIETSEPGDPPRHRPNVESSAAVGPDGTIYIGNFPGNLAALKDTGKGDTLELLWRFHPTGGAASYHATPLLGEDGTIYIGFSTGGATPEAKGAFYALKPSSSGSDPEVKWSVDLGPGRQTSSPMPGPDGTIYVVSGVGKLFALTSDGAVKWTAKTGPQVKASVALGADGTIYLPSMNGKLYAVSPPNGTGSQEGSIRWTFDFGEHLGEKPLVTASVPPPGANAIGSGASPTIGPDGTIYVGANNSNFYAIKPDGTLKWMFEAEREVAGIWSTAALSPDGKTLYFGANRGGIYALSAEDGSKEWQFPIYGSVYNSPTLDSKGTLYTGSTFGHVYAIDSATGELVWDYDAGGAVWTAPTIRADGTLVVATTKGKVILLGER